MDTYEQENFEAEKLSPISRITRVVFGVALVAFAMSHSGVLGALAVLPLLAIYPILTGIIGYGLVEQLFMLGRLSERPVHITRAIHVSKVVLGVVMIGAVISGVTSQTWLALLGIYPILSGGFGLSLLGEAVRTRCVLQHAARVYPMTEQALPWSKTMGSAVTADARSKKAA